MSEDELTPLEPLDHRMPAAEEFCLKVPLYEEFTGSYFRVEQFEGTLDMFCVECGRHSVFNRTTKNRYEEHAEQFRNHRFELSFSCSRDRSHQTVFLFMGNLGRLQKIGQYPSLADLAIPDLEKYRVVLTKERYKELNRGVGLAAHGVGIGAFVYLRRVFEAQIEEARLRASTEPGWSQEEFERHRMEDKITMLRTHLPEFLVSNRSLYAILSAGVHELSEENCLEAFPVVKLGIELILDDILAEREREQKVKASTQAIGVLKGRVKPVL